MTRSLTAVTSDRNRLVQVYNSIPDRGSDAAKRVRRQIDRAEREIEALSNPAQEQRAMPWALVVALSAAVVVLVSVGAYFGGLFMR